MERRRTFLTLKEELRRSVAPYYIPQDALVQIGEISLLGCNYFYTQPFVLKLLKLTLAALLLFVTMATIHKGTKVLRAARERREGGR